MLAMFSSSIVVRFYILGHFHCGYERNLNSFNLVHMAELTIKLAFCLYASCKAASAPREQLRRTRAESGDRVRSGDGAGNGPQRNKGQNVALNEERAAASAESRSRDGNKLWPRVERAAVYKKEHSAE